MIAQPDPDRRVVGIRVLESQPDLAQGLDPDQAALARRHVVAVLDTIEPGAWEPAYEESPGAIGLLVIDGMLARDLRIAERWSSELLGPGDVLRPWDYADGRDDSVSTDSSWTALSRVRVAVLDERFARVACRFPQLMAGLLSRTLRRSRWMTIMLGISNLTRVNDRVLGLMWHLADRWGHVTPNGVVVPVPLTHEMIGKLVGAHRPSVTSALGELSRDGRLERRENGWLLHGAPPERLRAEPDQENGARPARRRLRSVDPTALSMLPALASGVFG